MAFIGWPMAGQQVTPQTLDQASQQGSVDLASLAAGLPGGGPQPGPAGGPAPGDQTDQSQSDANMSDGDRLNRVLNDLLTIAGGSDHSEQEKASLQQAMTLVQKIKAQQEKESQDALGGKVSPRLLSQAYAGAGGGGGGAQGGY